MEARSKASASKPPESPESEELLLRSESRECDLDEMSVNSLDMLKAVMEPSSSENESSGSSSRGGCDSRSVKKDDEAGSARKRKQSKSERDRKYRNRSWSAENRGQSNSPVMEQRRCRIAPSNNGRISRFRRRPRMVSPPFGRYRSRRSRSPLIRVRRFDSRSRSPVSRSSFRSRRSRAMSHSRSPIRDYKSHHAFPANDDESNQEFLNSPSISSCGLKSVVVVPKSSSRCDDRTISDEESNTGDRSNQEKNKCRDFEEKGLCLRGELCPYDHGKDPIVVGDILHNAPAPTGPTALQGVGRSFTSRPRIPSPSTGGSNAVMSDEYFPENPSLEPNFGWHPPHFRPRQLGFGFMTRGRGGMFFRPPTFGAYPNSHGQRQLISVQLRHAQNVSPGGHFRSPHLSVPNHGGPSFEHGRSSFKPIRNRFNSSLEVRKIPKEQNNIQQLNAHFSQFGKIVNIQINHEGDPEAALVTFISPEDAQKAHKSSEAVLNNRFIKVFWHNGNSMDVNANSKNESESNSNDLNPTISNIRLPVKHRLGYHPQPRMYASYPGAVRRPSHLFMSAGHIHQDVRTISDPIQQQDNSSNGQYTPPGSNCSRKSEDESSAKLSAEKQKKLETLKLTNDLRKRLQTMMDEQIRNQKKLIASLESGKLKPEEREETIKVLKSLQDSVEKLAKELNSTNMTMRQSHPQAHVESESKLKTQEEIQKEILDTELDLIKEEQNGKDPSNLRQKLFELNIELKTVQNLCHFRIRE